ncbi:MAG: hypothetical protein A3H31_08890 [Gallionellales bacterium RIFCSPLOWO2_02_FULL_57_47]|nr:MAG: hypothetical protein A3H31_08890 [Gallionellales bacterium RIFCSPLOWO2_02_FULL_57_47]OGT13623.1 MAG: hypothetical protein A3J49_00185 [Gallionellales bacterium RIFCSPHIGHO2_02_FULL_57_16]
MPVAVNGVVVPFAIEIEVGVTAMLVSVAAVTVILAAGDVMPLREAVMVVVPTATPDTTPVLGPTLAVEGAADVQVTEVVMSAVGPLE